jgi:hypothetical protein
MSKTRFGGIYDVLLFDKTGKTTVYRSYGK